MTLRVIFLIVAAVVSLSAVAYLKKQERYRVSLHRKYLLSIVGVLIFLACAGEIYRTFHPDVSLNSVLLGGSALIVAVVGFAAQPVINNVICGLLISLQRPFEVGDRIIVGDMSGIVEDITLRHTILRLYDGFRLIIPNGELNSKIVTNTSYGMPDRRGIYLRFSVSYDTDVPKAMEVIRDCVAKSPYTLGVETNGIKEDSGPVYFLDFGDSDLVLSTSIWISRNTNTQQAVTDVNVRVLEAFRKYGIEIPYPYFNVLQGEYTPTVAAEPEEKDNRAVLRYRKTDALRLAPEERGLDEAIETGRRFAGLQRMDGRAALQLELLTEETMGLMQQFTEQSWREFWIEGSRAAYRIHLRTFVQINSLDEYQKLIKLSSTGQNEVLKSVNARILEAVLIGRDKLLKKNKGQEQSVEWQLSEEKLEEDEIGKSILGKLASDVRVSINREWVELTVLKKTGES